jgi:hypothetical protein
MGRKAEEDSAVLKKMALGLAEKKYGNPWEAAGDLAKQATGNSVEAARKRIHRKFLKNKEALLEAAREELGIEDDSEDDEELIYGFDSLAFERLANYLLGLKTNSERAQFVAKFLNWRRERADLYNKIIQHVRARGHLTPDDMLFIHVLLAKMESQKMHWMDILWKSLASPRKDGQFIGDGDDQQTTEKK